MFGLFSKRKQIRAIAKRLLEQATGMEPLFRMGGLESVEKDAGKCDVTKAPVLIRTLLVEYALQNLFALEIRASSATEKEYETLVCLVAEEMKSNLMFGEQAITYWDDLKDVGVAFFGTGRQVAAPETIGRMYGFWFLKNICYPNLEMHGEASLLVGLKLLENLRRLFKVGSNR